MQGLLAALRARSHQALPGFVVALAGGTVRAGGCGERDPCAKQLATPVLPRHELAMNVLVERVPDQTSRLKNRPIYVRIVEVAGSSPVTSTFWHRRGGAVRGTANRPRRNERVRFAA
jgi:hypothetical protein